MLPVELRPKAQFRQACTSPERLLELLEADARDAPASVATPVRSLPLLLISQLPRSGGSLLSQLLDAHPQVLVYPGEMKVGYPSKSNWPQLDPTESPELLYATLYHWDLAAMASAGHLKLGAVLQDAPRIPFTYSAVTHAKQFLAALPRVRSARDVLDTYFTTLFASWQPERLNEARDRKSTRLNSSH